MPSPSPTPSTTNATKPTRAAIYCRVSTTGHGQDVGLQLDELRAVAKQRGWTIAGEFLDEGISGSKSSRPALDKLMSAARAHEIDAVLVWRFDRFARSTGRLLQALEEFRILKVDFISVREQIDTSTPMGKAMFTIVAVIAELERGIIEERVRAGTARAKSQGKHCGRPRRDVDLDLAKMFLDQGHGVRRVAGMMGIPKSTLIRHLEAG